MTSLTIRTAKGRFTGTLTEICEWQAEQQAANADINGVDVSDIDFDAEGIDGTIERVQAAIVAAAIETIDAYVAEGWDDMDGSPEATAAWNVVREACRLVRDTGAPVRDVSRALAARGWSWDAAVE